MMRIFILFCIGMQLTAFADPAGREMADAANKFLGSLKPDQRTQAVFEFKDEQRLGRCLESRHFGESSR